MESYDFDLFDYWDDLLYCDDEYWDHGGIETGTLKIGQKRKRNVKNSRMENGKRQKLSLMDTEGGGVRFISLAVRNRMAETQPPVLDRRESFALLPDWRERFAGQDSGVVMTKSMPEEMKKAAEGKDEHTPPKARQMNAEVAEGDEAWEDEDEAEDEDEEGDLQAELASLDPEMMKAVLKQKLGDAGLEGMDEGAFMQTIAKMLGGEEGADGAADDLANQLLGQATEGNGDAALSGWLSQQGVPLDAAEEEGDETSSVATADLPEAASSGRKAMQVSPPDSAIEMSKAGGGGGGATAELAIHNSSPSASAKKRMAPTEDLDDESMTKRKKVTFDVPLSSEPFGPEAEEGEGGSGVSAKTAAPDPSTSEDPLMSEPTIRDDKSSRVAAESKATNIAAVENNEVKPDGITGPGAVKSKSKSARRAKTTAAAGTEADKEANVDNDEDAIAPAKQTRKRKAEDVENAAPAPKKQAKKAAVAETAGQGTRRSARATKAGK